MSTWPLCSICPQLPRLYLDRPFLYNANNFLITFQDHRDKTEPEHDVGHSIGDNSGRTMIRVMVVIEDAELANLIGLVLYHRGYQVNLDRSVAGACEQVASVRPDLLIASKRQFKSDQIVYHALQATRRCPILWIGDTTDSTTEARFRTDHLSIPFGAQELVKRIEEVLTNDHSARSNSGSWPNRKRPSLSKLSRPDSSLDKHILP